MVAHYTRCLLYAFSVAAACCVMSLPPAHCFDLFPVKANMSDPEDMVMLVSGTDNNKVYDEMDRQINDNDASNGITSADVMGKVPSAVSIDKVSEMLDKLSEGTGKEPMDLMLDMVMDGKGGGDPNDKICDTQDRIIFYGEEKCKGPKIGSIGSKLEASGGCEVVSLEGEDCVQLDMVKSLLVLPGIMKVDDAMVVCAAGAACTKEDVFKITLLQEVELPLAYCVDDFEKVYEDSHVITKRGDDDGVMPESMPESVPTESFGLAVCM